MQRLIKWVTGIDSYGHFGPEGGIVHINDPLVRKDLWFTSERGISLRKRVYCEKCGWPLDAYKCEGSKTRPHFQHSPCDDEGRSYQDNGCNGVPTGEGRLHSKACEIIRDNFSKMRWPEKMTEYVPICDQVTERTQYVDCIDNGLGIRSDITGWRSGEQALAIEVIYAHGLDRKKREIIKLSNVIVFSIYIRGWDGKSSFEDFVLSAPCAKMVWPREEALSLRDVAPTLDQEHNAEECDRPVEPESAPPDPPLYPHPQDDERMLALKRAEAARRAAEKEHIRQRSIDLYGPTAHERALTEMLTNMARDKSQRRKSRGHEW